MSNVNSFIVPTVHSLGVLVFTSFWDRNDECSRFKYLAMGVYGLKIIMIYVFHGRKTNTYISTYSQVNNRKLWLRIIYFDISNLCVKLNEKFLSTLFINESCGCKDFRQYFRNFFAIAITSRTNLVAKRGFLPHSRRTNRLSLSNKKNLNFIRKNMYSIDDEILVDEYENSSSNI